MLATDVHVGVESVAGSMTMDWPACPPGIGNWLWYAQINHLCTHRRRRLRPAAATTQIAGYLRLRVMDYQAHPPVNGEFRLPSLPRADTGFVRLDPTVLPGGAGTAIPSGWPPRTLADSAVAERKANPLAGHRLRVGAGFPGCGPCAVELPRPDGPWPGREAGPHLRAAHSREGNGRHRPPTCPEHGPDDIR
jgi:hypothetical protein